MQGLSGVLDDHDSQRDLHLSRFSHHAARFHRVLDAGLFSGDSSMMKTAFGVHFSRAIRGLSDHHLQDGYTQMVSAGVLSVHRDLGACNGEATDWEGKTDKCETVKEAMSTAHSLATMGDLLDTPGSSGARETLSCSPEALHYLAESASRAWKEGLLRSGAKVAGAHESFTRMGGVGAMTALLHAHLGEEGGAL